MTAKTQQAKTVPPHGDDVDSVGGENAAAASPETAASAYAVLQTALAEVGEELERHQRTAGEQLDKLQKKLAELSQQMERVATGVQSKLAALDAARRAAEESAARASAAAATQHAPAPSAAGLDGQPDAPEPASSSRVAEMPVAATPPPAAAQPVPAHHTEAPYGAQQPAAPPSAAAHPAPVAARPIRQAIAAPRPAAAPSNLGAWDRIVFGESLAKDVAFAADRASLLQGLAEQDDTAVSLVGQLMIFNAASAERMPQLLKDVGEAYYAWRPHAGGDNFRDALIAYLDERCQTAGIGNTIELVRPGDRFDAMRHNSKQRGVEIVDVFGWVVLRDNGKVYTKASVAVK